ncbi:MAG: benzoate-CoA ligase family protein [Acidobacteriota bacterium]|nr:benzoate-CoA ligase family protein [Blastocatellia bacterium]MDW8413652.1 benzoate-CoA ligase family protein [Acidobacteriota bacterium]
MFPERFNMYEYFLESNLEAGRGDKVAVYFRDEKYTYEQIIKETNRVGNVLRELGVEIEDRVLMVLPDCPEFVATWFAITKLGAVITMVNPLLAPQDFDYYLDYTRAKVAVVEASVLERVEPAAKKARYLKNLLVVDRYVDVEHRYPSYSKLVPTAPDCLDTAPTSKDDIAIWLFTSGSTGQPKAAVHLQHDLPYNTECYPKHVLQMTEQDITLGVPKLFFGYATGTNLLFPFRFGASTALFYERSTPETVFAMIERYRPTVLTNVPTMINAMLQLEGDYDLTSLRVCISAGEALPEELYRRWIKRFGVEILDGIGSAELFHIYISNRFGEVRPGSLGRIVPGYEAQIVDAEGRVVPTGEIGTLRVRGDSAAICYWNAHEKSKATFAGDWVTSADLFRVDEEGYYWYAGRSDDMLKVGGIFVSPLEIENCLLQHPAVAECAVVGASDEHGLVKPKAFVVLRAGYEAAEGMIDELQQFAKQRMAPYKYPRLVEFVASLPKNDRGKVDKKLLKG